MTRAPNLDNKYKVFDCGTTSRQLWGLLSQHFAWKAAMMEQVFTDENPINALLYLLAESTEMDYSSRTVIGARTACRREKRPWGREIEVTGMYLV